MNSMYLVLSAVCFILGTVLLAGGNFGEYYRHSNERYKGRALATVIEVIADKPDAAGVAAGIHTYYYPVFAYYAAGRLIKVRYTQGGYPCPYKMNEQVKICYDVHSPEKFVLAEPQNLKKVSKTGYYLGIILLVAGVAFFLIYATRFFR